MKKWTMSVLMILVVGIAVIVYKGSGMGLEDYLDLAATFHEREDYDQEMFNLEKLWRALWKSTGRCLWKRRIFTGGWGCAKGIWIR